MRTIGGSPLQGPWRRLPLAFVLVLASGACAPSGDGPAGAAPLIVRTREATGLFFDVAPDGSIVLDIFGQLWEVPASGGEATPLRGVDPTVDDRHPDVSPDGAWVVVRSDRVDGRGIWLLGRGSPAARPLTDSAAILGHDAGGPTWSPDGTRVAYAQSGSIELVDVATGARERVRPRGLEDAALDEPDWSPDGRRLLVSGPWRGGSARPLLDGPAGAGILEIDLSTGETRARSGPDVAARAPAWAPDGRGIAYVAAADSGGFVIMVQPADGAPLVVASDAGIEPRRVRWDPDGTSLVYVAEGRLRRVAATGGASRSVPFVVELRASRTRYVRARPRLPAPGTRAEARGFHGLAIAPDGRSVGVLAVGALWSVDGTGAARRLAPMPPSATGLAWSPDGSEVVWSGGPVGAQDLWITDVRSGSARRVTTSSGSDARAAWSPDGGHLAFVHASWRLHWVELRGIDPVETAGPEIPWPELAALGYIPQWLPSGDTVLLYGMGGWPVVQTDCASAVLVPLRGEPLPVERFPCRPAHAVVGPDGGLVSVEDGVLVERPRVSGGWGAPSRVGSSAALHPSVARDGTLAWIGADGLRLRSADGSERSLGWPVAFEPPDAPPLVVRGARIVSSGRTGDPGPQDVLVEHGRIVEVAVAGSLSRAVPAGAVELDGRGAWLMPGLIDTHTHLIETGAVAPTAALYHGVTTLREMWGPLALVAAWRDDVDAGVVDGARVVVSGFPVYPWPGARPVTSDFLWLPGDSVGIDRGLTLLRAFDAGHVKMRYVQTWSGGAMVVRRAHAFGLPVGGHCAHALAVVTAGIDTHEHADGQCGDWSFGVHEDVARLYGAAGVALDPVIDLHDQDARVAVEPGLLDLADVRPFREGLAPPGPVDARLLERLRARAERARRTTATFRAAGVRVVLGSDAEPSPGGVARELEALVAAGSTPEEALRAATVDAAVVLGLDHELGRVEPGYRADFLLLDADPLQDVGHVRRIREIVRDGRRIDREALRTGPLRLH